MVDDTSAADEYALGTPAPSAGPKPARRPVARRTAALLASGALVLGLIGGGAIVALTPLGDSSSGSQQAGPGAGGRPDGQQMGQLPGDAPTGRPEDQDDAASDDASAAT